MVIGLFLSWLNYSKKRTQGSLQFYINYHRVIMASCRWREISFLHYAVSCPEKADQIGEVFSATH